MNYCPSSQTHLKQFYTVVSTRSHSKASRGTLTALGFTQVCTLHKQLLNTGSHIICTGIGRLPTSTYSVLFKFVSHICCATADTKCSQSGHGAGDNWQRKEGCGTQHTMVATAKTQKQSSHLEVSGHREGSLQKNRPLAPPPGQLIGAILPRKNDQVPCLG